MNIHRFIIIVLVIFCVCSCKHKEGEYHSLRDKIDGETKKYQDPEISSEAYIGDIKTIEIVEGEHRFLIPERKSQISSFACTECHTQPIDKMKRIKGNKRAHWDLQMQHADEKAMNCASCHMGDNMDNLKSLTGSTIDFNQSYLLCAQCHNTQFQDWKGGAHGKNIGGWAKPRAAMTCVNCHNPHQPQIASKWPVQFNTEIEKERK